MSSIKKARLQRERQVRHIVKILPSKKSLDALGDPKKLPMTSLFAATQRYVLGTYDDCVLHSAFSVEMALLLKLDQELEAKEKEEIKKQSARAGALSFGKVIRMAEKRHILSKNNMDKVWVLYNLRNMFAHPGNWVTFVKRQSPEVASKMVQNAISDLPAMMEGIKAIAKQKVVFLESAGKKLQKYADRRLGKIPNLEWAAHQGTLSFQQERTKSYYVRITKDFLTRKTLEDFIKHLNNFPEYVQKRYPYPQEIAFEALEIAFEILKHLDIL